jgi:hypothetical protein
MTLAHPAQAEIPRQESATVESMDLQVPAQTIQACRSK